MEQHTTVRPGMTGGPRATRTHTMTVADLKDQLADLPDWAAVQVLTYDETGCCEEHDPYLNYTAGVLTIDGA